MHGNADLGGTLSNRTIKVCAITLEQLLRKESRKIDQNNWKNQLDEFPTYIYLGSSFFSIWFVRFLKFLISHQQLAIEAGKREWNPRRCPSYLLLGWANGHCFQESATALLPCKPRETSLYTNLQRVFTNSKKLHMHIAVVEILSIAKINWKCKSCLQTTRVP